MTDLEKDLLSVPYEASEFAGRGFLNEKKQKALDAFMGRHVEVTEIRLVPYVCDAIAFNHGLERMRDNEAPFFADWIEKDGIIDKENAKCDLSFTEKGRKFAKFIIKWAYPTDYSNLAGAFAEKEDDKK